MIIIFFRSRVFLGFTKGNFSSGDCCPLRIYRGDTPYESLIFGPKWHKKSPGKEEVSRRPGPSLTESADNGNCSGNDSDSENRNGNDHDHNFDDDNDNDSDTGNDTDTDNGTDSTDNINDNGDGNDNENDNDQPRSDPFSCSRQAPALGLWGA